MDKDVTAGLGRVAVATICAMVLAAAGLAQAIASSSAHDSASFADHPAAVR